MQRKAPSHEKGQGKINFLCTGQNGQNGQNTAAALVLSIWSILSIGSQLCIISRKNIWKISLAFGCCVAL